MIVAVTGGTGAVGRRIVERHLAAGDVVRVLSRQEKSSLPADVEVHRGDLASEPQVLSRFVDTAQVLYHCAAETRDTHRMTEVNADGTRNLIAAADRAIGRWVHVSSIAVYGTPRRGVIGEQTPFAPVDAYGHSKAEADRLVRAAAARGAFDCCVVRPAKVFGAATDSANNRILFELFSLIERGLFFFVGPPGALTHYVHIDDLVDALVLCGRAEFAGSRAYNLSDDCELEVFVAFIAAALGRDPPTLRLPERPVRWFARAFGAIPGFPLDGRRVDALVNRAAFPVGQIAQELGYVHRIPLERALRELVAEWRRQRGAMSDGVF